MSLVLTDIEATGLAKIVLNRPDKLNALSMTMINDLTACVRELTEQANDKSIRAVLIRAVNSKAFCVGADLTERLEMNDAAVRKALDALRILMDSLASIPVPTLAVIEGPAFGGGLELALACDLRLASPSAQMGLTETKLAILPGAGGTQRLARLVGPARAKEMIFLGKRMTSTEALYAGVVNWVGENPLGEAEKWAEQICEAGPIGIQNAKAAIDSGLNADTLAQGLDVERACYEKTIPTQDRTEGLRAFVEKRKPVYRGE